MINDNISSTIYETHRLFLKVLTTDFVGISNYVNWFNDEEVCKYNSHGVFPMSKDGIVEYIKDQRNKVIWAMVTKDERIHIGNISLQEINWVNRSAEFAIILGEKSFWGKGFSIESANKLLDHGFNKMNLNRIYLGTAANNAGMNSLAKKMGMRQEGVRRCALFLNGEYIDLNEYGILKNEYHF